MNYAIDHERFDPFNFNRYVAEIVTELPSGLVKVLAFLSGHISYSSSHKMFPKGMVSGLSAQKIADRIGMGLSTVRGHLADAKRRNIIATLTLEDRHGRTVGVRYFFPGFSDWLHDGGFMSRRGDKPSLQETGDKSPLQETGGRGSSISDPNKIIDSSNKIIHDGKLNLEFEGSIIFTEVAAAIREAKPMINGKAADPNKVWTDFCLFNKKKGKRWLPLKWLIGFCRVYGRKKSTTNTQSQPKTSDPAISVPTFSGETPLDLVSKQIYESKGAAVWSNWIKPLKARRNGNIWIIEAPSAFHSSYVRTHFEAIFDGCFGRHAVHFA